MEYILLITALYLLILVSSMTTAKNFLSKVVFKLIPLVLSFLLIIYFMLEKEYLFKP
jgi:hypothetical protein